MNMLDDQAIDIDTGIRGASVSYIGENLISEIIAGNQNIWRSTSQALNFNNRIPNYKTENSLYGAHLNYFIGEWSLYTHFLNVNEKHPFPGTNITNKIRHNLFGFGINYFSDTYDFSSEYVLKDELGKGVYANVNLYLNNWSIGASYKNYIFNELSPYSRWDFVNFTDGILPFQQMPTLTAEHSSPLLSRITHIVDYNDELGYSLQADGTLYNKFNIHINYSKSSRRNAWELNTNHNWKVTENVNFQPSTRWQYNPFEEIYFEISRHEPLEKIQFLVAIASTSDVVDIFNNQTVDEMSLYSYEKLKALTIPLSLTYLIGESYSVNFRSDYQILEKGFFQKIKGINSTESFTSNFSNKNQINRFFSLGLAKSPVWSVTLNIDYSNSDIRQSSGNQFVSESNKNNFIEDALSFIINPDKTWANLELSYNINQKNQLSLSYGSQKGGVLCSNGVCRYVQAFENGYKIALISTF